MRNEINVLHVDDEPSITDLTATFLQRENDQFCVQTATSAEEGLNIIDEGRPDCVVSDYNMPSMDGIAFLRKVREGYPKLPFILFTGQGSEDIASEAIAADATDYLQKGSGSEQYELLANRILNNVKQQRSEERLRKTEEEYTAVFENARNGLLLVDVTPGRFRYEQCNPWAATLIGLDRTEIEGYTPREAFGPENGQKVVGAYRTCIQQCRSVEYTVSLDLPAGQVVRQCEVSPVESDGEIVQLVVAFQDITEQRRRDRELEKIETLFDHAQDSLFLINAGDEFTVEQVNPAYEAATGLSIEHLRGQTPQEILGEQQGAAVERRYHECVERCEPLEYTEQVQLGEGITKWETRIAPVVLDDSVEYIVGATRDVTGREDRQQELRRLRQAIDDANVSITLADPSKEDNPLVYVNNAFEETTGYPPDDTLGLNCRFLQGEDTNPEKIDALRKAIRNEEPISVELRNYRKDGTQFWNKLTVTPIYDDDDELIRYLGTQEDITERKEREKQLTELNRTTQALIKAENQQEIADIGVEAASNILGLQANAIHFSEDDDTQLVPKSYTDRAAALADEMVTLPVDDSIAGRVYTTGEPETIENVQQDPDVYDPEADPRSFMYLPLGDYGVLIAGAEEQAAFDQQDLTLGELLAGNLVAALDRVTRKERLEEVKSQYQTLAENFPEGAVFLYDTSLRVVRAGGLELSNVGLSSEELVGTTPHEQYPTETADELVDHLENALNGAAETFEQKYAGNQYQVQTVPVRTDNGEVDHVMAVSRNITEQAMQRQEIERQNERLEEFTSIISHDLRSPLSVAQGHLELAEETADEEHFEKASDAIKRSQDLIDDLLTLAREGKQIDEVTSVDLTEVAQESWDTVETAQATLSVDGPAVIEADQCRVQQLFENLYRNAVEHGGEDITVHIGALNNGFYVADTGRGIPEDHREEVFDAGFSTADDGIGFGLQIVEQIVKAHGWDISVTESEQGGVRFEIANVEGVDPDTSGSTS